MTETQNNQNPSKREQLAQLMGEAQADELSAVREFASFVDSTEGKVFREKIESFHQRTVPGSNFDQIFGSILQIIEGSGNAAKAVTNPPEAGNNDQTEQTASETAAEMPAADGAPAGQEQG